VDHDVVLLVPAPARAPLVQIVRSTQASTNPNPASVSCTWRFLKSTSSPEPRVHRPTKGKI